MKGFKRPVGPFVLSVFVSLFWLGSSNFDFAAAESADAVEITWKTQATQYRGKNGQTFTFHCPPGGKSRGRVWGADVYTDDSSICLAAAHAGALSLNKGGSVTIKIIPGRENYKGLKRNGVISNGYGRWKGSFVFITDSGDPSRAADFDAVDITWSAHAKQYRGKNGQTFKLRCPPGGRTSSAWGTDFYTDDSSICAAAAHAGIISLAEGGVVVIEISPGRKSYEGSSRHGVKTDSYGGWAGSYSFVRHPSAPAKDDAGDAVEIAWDKDASQYRGRNGESFRFHCPPGGTANDDVWGADVYTDDSSICTAAVHAGEITASGGGGVTLRIEPGRDTYASSLRNGILTIGYGRWKGGFSFSKGAGKMAVMNAEEITWTTQAKKYRGQNGRTFSYRCPGGKPKGAVWGTDTYTDDSSICNSAVHAGVISASEGGVVTIEIAPGQKSYQGSKRHGLTSANYGAWGGSFLFVAR